MARTVRILRKAFAWPFYICGFCFHLLCGLCTVIAEKIGGPLA
jgi:hypothetical protein